MESLVEALSLWRGKRVFITGHTGFKGGWLSLWLTELGAEVFGYALAPDTASNLFDELSLEPRLAKSTLGDIRNVDDLKTAMRAADPEVVIHMAAQPLVRQGYLDPLATYETNVMGTCNVLHLAAQHSGAKAVLVVTTDKCYENREWTWPYRESDPLGGHDPYSSSKACAEIATSAFSRSFLQSSGIWAASARAGNVIGGGDWSADRLIPDLWRSYETGEPVKIRLPHATRPWQHVLEPLAGYLLLSGALLADGESFQGAWNFGPDSNDVRSVSAMADQFCSYLPGLSWELGPSPSLHESTSLALDSSKARAALGWTPLWTAQKALEVTADWFKAYQAGSDMYEFSAGQIRDYMT